MKVYADAIAVLERNAVSVRNTGKGFEKAHQDAERARRAYQSAREKLNEHIASHGCE